MHDSSFLNEISELADDGLHRKTIAAVRIILGGLDTQGFWGFSFSSFARRFDTRLKSYLPDPARVQLNLMPGFNALRDVHDAQVDYISDPARNFSLEEAVAAAARARVIGLAGEHGCGRATLAQHLVDVHGFTRVSFDDPVRVAASVLYNIPFHYFSDAKLATTPIPALESTPRRVMDIIAGDVCQGLRRSIWSDRLVLRVAGVARMDATGEPRVVVNGLRFQDEAEHIRSMENSLLAWVTRNPPSVARPNSASRPGDTFLHNDSSPQAFLEKAVGALGLARHHRQEVAEPVEQRRTPVTP